MNWGDRADMIRRFYFGRGVRPAPAEQEIESTIEDGFRILLVDQGVALITAYHEAGETDEAFETLRRSASALAIAAARLKLGGELVDDQILGAIETRVEPMYDELTANRLIAAFRRGFGRSGCPRFGRA
jgi:hypothetical protein